ncbi:MAG: FAD-dependent oxidoreductase [Spirochaetaceae bacterium]
MNNKNYDVIVIGGGTAGVIAAIQAGRAGANTLIVEKTGIFGGTITNGGVNFPGLFHAWGKQIIGGIGWELVERTVKESGETLPDFSNYQGHHSKLQIPINKFVYGALADELIVDAGVDVLFHSMPSSINKDKSTRGWNVNLCTKSGVLDLTATILIDTTGDANVVTLGGFPTNVPEETQPATLSCLASGYNLSDLDIETINRNFDREVKAGRLSYTDVSWNTTAPDIGVWLHNKGANSNHIHHINAYNSQNRTELELESRKALFRLYRFLRTQPGLENLVIDQVSHECGVRETKTIIGKSTITVQDYQTARIWNDAVCYAFYPIDLHSSSGEGLDMRELGEGKVPSVPRGALLPEGSKNLLTAGRCISSDRLANSALRVQATCMATAQAAGAMAALSVQTGMELEELPIKEIHTLLYEHGAIVPEIG